MVEIDYIGNYDIDVIRKGEEEKINLESNLIKLIKKDSDIKEKLINILEKNGVLVCLTKNKSIYAINIFENNHESNELKLNNKIIADEVNTEDIEKFNKVSKNIVENLFISEEFDKLKTIKIKDKVINVDHIKKKEIYATLFVVCGMFFGIVFHHFFVGLFIGILLGLFIYYLDRIKNSFIKKDKNV